MCIVYSKSAINGAHLYFCNLHLSRAMGFICPQPEAIVHIAYMAYMANDGNSHCQKPLRI